MEGFNYIDIRVQTRIIKMHPSGVIVNIRQPNVKNSLSKLQCELCKSAHVRSPDELAHVTWGFNGSQMFTTQEPTQKNISTYHISQSKKIIFRDSSYILGKKNLFSLISKHVTNRQPSIEKEPLLPTSLLSLCFCGFGRIMKSSLLLGEERKNESGEKQ